MKVDGTKYECSDINCDETCGDNFCRMEKTDKATVSFLWKLYFNKFSLYIMQNL